ncbi:MAG TPA: DUF3096 domain-containing protein [Candidatus Faecivivens stercoripullorum]|uniref:DUF3096 domain-containing protein n=1 Tax=Candidatus Faecivivens stercoripullorum TaxID=2840805 RepID=A0A9D1KQX0_9FIRM|nr:DUF3096 domain-containing protein [Candidatus Faecivivens stercoripullorum]
MQSSNYFCRILNYIIHFYLIRIGILGRFSDVFAI